MAHAAFVPNTAESLTKASIARIVRGFITEADYEVRTNAIRDEPMSANDLRQPMRLNKQRLIEAHRGGRQKSTLSGPQPASVRTSLSATLIR